MFTMLLLISPWFTLVKIFGKHLPVVMLANTLYWVLISMLAAAASLMFSTIVSCQSSCLHAYTITGIIIMWRTFSFYSQHIVLYSKCIQLLWWLYPLADDGLVLEVDRFDPGKVSPQENQMLAPTATLPGDYIIPLTVVCGELLLYIL